MPQKSLDRREQLAKRAGTTETLKDTDLEGSEPLDPHEAKKSGHSAAQIAPPDRSASPRQAPGEGQASIPRRDASEAKDHFRSEAGEGSKPGHHRKEDR